MFKISWITDEKTLFDWYNFKIASGFNQAAINRYAVAIALNKGIIKRQPCLKCGRKSLIQAHHPEEKNPLKIVWLCRKHHTEIHNFAYTRAWIEKQNVKII